MNAFNKITMLQVQICIERRQDALLGLIGELTIFFCFLFIIIYFVLFRFEISFTYHNIYPFPDR